MTRTTENQAAAAQKIVGSVEKGVGQITTTVKTGTDKVAEAVKRTATTNESGNQNVPMAVSAVHKGLHSIAVATAEIAEHVRTHPDNFGGATKAATSIGKQFADLTYAAEQVAENGQRLREVAAEASKASDWVAGQFCGNGNVSVNNSFGRVVSSFGDL